MKFLMKPPTPAWVWPISCARSTPAGHLLELPIHTCFRLTASPKCWFRLVFMLVVMTRPQLKQRGIAHPRRDFRQWNRSIYTIHAQVRSCRWYPRRTNLAWWIPVRLEILGLSDVPSDCESATTSNDTTLTWPSILSACSKRLESGSFIKAHLNPYTSCWQPSALGSRNFMKKYLSTIKAGGERMPLSIKRSKRQIGRMLFSRTNSRRRSKVLSRTSSRMRPCIKSCRFLGRFVIDSTIVEQANSFHRGGSFVGLFTLLFHSKTDCVQSTGLLVMEKLWVVLYRNTPELSVCRSPWRHRCTIPTTLSYMCARWRVSCSSIIQLYSLILVDFRGDEAAMADIFEMARRFSPCILVLEDIDSHINERSVRHCGVILLLKASRNRSFFLNQVCPALCRFLTILNVC